MSEKRPQYVEDALEMAGIDLDTPKQILQEVSGFTPLFDVVVNQYKDETRAAVHGAIWRFCQMSDGVCKASLATIATMIGVDISTVSRHADALVEDGYFVDLTPELRNRPHILADTGKVVMKSRLSAGFAQSKATIAQSKATIAQSRMSKDLNKDLEENGDKSPTSDQLSSMPLEWQLVVGVEKVVVPDDTQAQRKDAANLIATGFGSNSRAAYDLAMAFQNERNITFTESDIKGQRKAIKAMLEKKVQPNHVAEAVKELVSKHLTVVDLFGVVKTAIDMATRSDFETEKVRLL